MVNDGNSEQATVDLPFVSCLCPTYRRPALLANSMACFVAQDYPADRRELIILDDAGQLQCCRHDGWEVISIPRRFQSLPEKFNAIAGLAKGEILFVWEDDDIYLPWHLSVHVESLRGSHGYSKPSRVRSHFHGEWREEDASGRFHASIGFTRALFNSVGGWPLTHRGDFDQQFMARLSQAGPPVDPVAHQPPSYVFRWEATNAYHGQGLMQSSTDEGWYQRVCDVATSEHPIELFPEFDSHTLQCFAVYGLLPPFLSVRNPGSVGAATQMLSASTPVMPPLDRNATDSSSEKRPRKIIGVIRISDAFAEHCHLTIELLSRFCDGICFVTSCVTRPEVLSAMENCGNRLGSTETQSPWSHHASFRDAYNLGIAHGADWIVMPDHDEILPYDYLLREIDEAERQGKYVISFPFLNCWESPSTVIAPSLNRTGSHGKVFRAGITDFRESSFCIPDGYWDQIYASSFPLRHCHMMTHQLRERRQLERGWIEPWAEGEPKTLAFVPEWTMCDYQRQEASETAVPDSGTRNSDDDGMILIDENRMLEICRTIPGWMEDSELIWIFQKAREVPIGGIWVELGSWNGRSLMAAGLGLRDGCELWGIDHFRGSPEHQPLSDETVGLACIKNLNVLKGMRPGLQCGILVSDVTAAAQRFANESVYTTFIDASHEYEAVTSQIRAWKPKITSDGRLCGHDYNRRDWPGVTRAVVELLPGTESGPCSIWNWAATQPPVLQTPVATLSVIIATIGRPSLQRTLESVRQQDLIPGDEIFVIHDGPMSPEVERVWNESGLPGRLVALDDGPHRDWGAAARTVGMTLANGSHLIWQDDDDTYLPGAFSVIRRECTQEPEAFLLFRMAYPNGWLLWQHPQVVGGNVTTQIFVAPRKLPLGVWGTHYAGDYDFIASSIERNPTVPVRFIDRVTVMFSRNG